MKETKKFFDTNRLNKGYSKMSINKQADVIPTVNQYRHVLPPLDIIAQYEEMSPGVISKIIDMAQKEQNHRHSMDLLNNEKYNRATKFGRMCSLILVAIIAATALALSFGEHYVIAAMFVLVTFGTIGIVSFTQRAKKINNKPFHKNFDRKNRVNNNKTSTNNRS